jgi:Ca2+-transporting ATPase
MRQPSPSPSDKTYTGSDATQNDGQKGDNAEVKRRGAQFLRPAVLDLNQESDPDVRPFSFNSRQLARLFYPKDLEILEVMGGVDAILRSLGTHPTHGLRTKLGLLSYHGLPDAASQDFIESQTAEKDLPMLNTVTSPAALLQGPQSSAGLAGSSGVSIPTAFQVFKDVYRVSIEDRQRIFGRNIIPRCTNKTLLQLMWLALKDKVLVC